MSNLYRNKKINALVMLMKKITDKKSFWETGKPFLFDKEVLKEKITLVKGNKIDKEKGTTDFLLLSSVRLLSMLTLPGRSTATFM